MNYKGYSAIVQYSDVDGVYWGKLDGINDLVLFESDTADGLYAAFVDAVDDYIETLVQVGRFEVSAQHVDEFHKKVAENIERQKHLKKHDVSKIQWVRR